MSRIGNAYRNLVTDDQMAFTHEQIHIGRIGEEIDIFVVDYKQSCKHLQAIPSRCGAQPRQIFSAEALAVRLSTAHQNTSFLKKHRI